ncbi:hypothetical protein PN836_017550 [Ningiella sp. W23]|uniref:hypothetical protein n=1 Tax=Ningiella sp. W23 TaxID=3023715 RepID=UPI0037581F97
MNLETDKPLRATLKHLLKAQRSAAIQQDLMREIECSVSELNTDEVTERLDKQLRELAVMVDRTQDSLDRLV